MKKVRITDRRLFPFCVREFEALRGISVGGCVNPRSTIDGAAHAHTRNKYRGWICLRFRYQLREKFVLLHEVAHLLTPANGHNRRWRNMVLKIGGTIEPFRSIARSMVVGRWKEYPGYTVRGRKYHSNDKDKQ